MSNFAAWQSLPKTMTPIGKWPFNRLPKGMKLADFEQLLEEFWNDDPIWPLVPLLDGFCLAIRESVFERIDLLDLLDDNSIGLLAAMSISVSGPVAPASA